MDKTYVGQIREFQAGCLQEEADKELILQLCLRYPDILTRENLVCHLTSSGLILNENCDKILMVHHNIYRTWTWTGGHADGEENLVDVALKEAVEETGVEQVRLLLPEMASLDIIPVYGHMKKGRYVSSHLHLNAAYVLQASEKEALSVCREENSGVAWIPLTEAPAHSGEPELIRIYDKMLKRLGVKFQFKERYL